MTDSNPAPDMDQIISRAVDEMTGLARTALTIANNDPLVAGHVMASMLGDGRSYVKNDAEWITVLMRSLTAIAIRLAVNESLPKFESPPDE